MFIHDPYRMIFVSIIATALLAAGVLLYRFIFPKKKISLLILIIFISVLPIISIFRNGDYESGDFNIHIYRNMSFYDALQEGQIHPTWSRDLNATYGYETFLIEAPLGDYLPALFHFAGFSFIMSMKLLLALSFIFSGIFTYLWAKQEFGETSGFVASIFYQFAPFHLIDMHFRAHPGDMLLYTFFPLLLFFIIQFLKKPKVEFFILVSITAALLILSHPLAGILIFFAGIYTFFLWSRDGIKKKRIIITFLAFIVGVGLSSFYWIPVIIESKYIMTALYPETVTFQPILGYLFSPWRYGLLFQGPQGQFSFVIGYIQWFIVIFCIVFLLRKKFSGKEQKNLLFYLICFFVIFIMLFPFTKPLWLILPIFKNLEFAYRILILAPLITGTLAAILVKRINKQWLTILICTLAIITTILNWGQRRVIPEITDVNLKNNLPYVTNEIEGGTAAVPRWVNPEKPWMGTIPKKHIEVLSGKGTFVETFRSSVKHEYVTDLSANAYIKENTYYYPGWVVTVDKNQVPITYTNKKYPGIITFAVPKGLHLITLTFTDTPVRFFAKCISIFTAFVIILLFIFQLKYFRKSLRKVYNK